MPRAARKAAAAVLSAAAIASLAACGSGTKTVTATGQAPVSQTASTARAQTSSTATSTPSTSATSTTGTSTRTGTEPAFTQNEAKSGSAGAAAGVVRAHGYTPNDTSQYRPDQTLRVLVGTRSGSSDGYGQQAFFFVDGRYIGTDTRDPSASVKLISQGDTEVTLGYPLYRPSDPLSSPRGGEAHVSFQLNNGKLVPLGTIPPFATSASLSRR